MPIVTSVFGLLLVALGVWGYIATEGKSGTALIPAFAGGPLILLGLLALVERFLKHAMHAAATIAPIGCVAAIGRFVVKLAKGGEFTDTAKLSLGGMALLCGVLVGLCVNSFIQVRRRRQAAAQTQTQG